ncbi:TRAP transporter substrate-binding protein [Marinobacterium aestuariivivens]|uniref:TRAP transporter substrate-binding protein n=1 Tax=Marinobacterium aestuariivivens TaxID=1698799 RepID=A0ABW1ZSN9_9GAMM
MKNPLKFCAALALSLTAALSQADTTKLTLSSWLPSGHPLVKDVIVPWTEQVEQATEGRVEIVMLPSALGHPKMHYDIARDGQADITYGAHGYTPGRFKLYKMVEFPFGGDSAEATSVAYWKVYNQSLGKAGEHRDVQLLGLFTHGPGHIHNSRKTVSAAADLKGLKLRVGGGIMNDLASDLGAVTLQKPSSSIYELMSSGVADGTLFPLESVTAFNIQDKATHTTLVPGGLYNFSFFVAMNRDRFAGLSQQDQDAVMSVSGEALARLAGRVWDRVDAAALEALKTNGNEITEAPEALIDEVRASVDPMVEAWQAEAAELGIDGAAALQAFRAESDAPAAP